MNMKDIKFEEALASLEEIIRNLESGALSLDDSLDAFSKAVELVKVCNSKLSDAEQKVKLLTEGADGEVTDVPFDMNKYEN